MKQFELIRGLIQDMEEYDFPGLDPQRHSCILDSISDALNDIEGEHRRKEFTINETTLNATPKKS